MTAIRFSVLDSEWNAEGELFAGGDHEVDQPSSDLVRLAAAAHAAGAITVHEGLDLSHVQSQEDGEAAYAAAQADGSWHEGNLIQAQLDADAKAAALAEIAASEAAEEDA